MVHAPCNNSKCSTPSAAAPAASPCSESSCKARQLSRLSCIRHNHQLGVWCRGGGGESLSNRTSRRTKRHNYQTYETSKPKRSRNYQRSTQAAHKWQSHTARLRTPLQLLLRYINETSACKNTHKSMGVANPQLTLQSTPYSTQQPNKRDHVASTTFAHAPCGSSPACRLHCSSSCSISRASTKPLPP